MKYYIKGNYYFDIDSHNQLRITGPQNHLMIGIPFPKVIGIEVSDFELLDDNLQLHLRCDVNQLKIPTPLVTDIRTLRQYTEQAESINLYQTLSSNLVEELLPQKITVVSDNLIEMINSYSDDEGEKQYGTSVRILNGTLRKLGNSIAFDSKDSFIDLEIVTLGNVKVPDPYIEPIFSQESISFNTSYLSRDVTDLYEAAQTHIAHLILTKKTSSLEYGTIFPRDWIESADLGNEDISQSAVEYMYEQSMRHISDKGEGWHEDLVGSYKTKFPDSRLHVDRKMIDIEPHYLLGLKLFSSSFSSREDIKNKLMLVAGYLLHNARQFSLITFKQVESDSSEYYHVGNWRDSYLAFSKQIAPLAPYDVNCVFYPAALKLISGYADYFEVDKDEVDALVAKWDQNKLRYRLYHDDLIGYSLALHSKKRLPLPIAHLDEAYDLFYGNPSMEEVISFSKKITDPEFFYTPVGPLLVSSDNEGYSTREYHGKVIWPKQAAFAMAGLTRHFFVGTEMNWPKAITDEIYDAAMTTAEACFRGWTELGAIPELYYYDEIEDRARFYTDQTMVEGQMSLIQLWSAIGARRIIRDYSRLRQYKDSL